MVAVCNGLSCQYWWFRWPSCLAMRRPNGAIIVSSVGALLAVAFQWYRERHQFPHGFYHQGDNILDTVISQVGGVLLLTAWMLALAHAAQARRWRWFVVLIVAVFLSESISILSQVLPESMRTILRSMSQILSPVCSPIKRSSCSLRWGRRLAPSSC